MNKLFYSKLAVINIRKNGKTYLPYVITCICTIMMFYIMHFISINKGISDSSSLQAILALGTIVIGIFSVLFLFYTNSFLFKRRKKEIGLYNILGLGKKHIAVVLLFENLYISLVSLVAGLAGGILLSKFMFLLLLKLLHFPVSFTFAVSVPSLVVTTFLFLGIFLLTLLFNLFHIHLAKPIELLRGGHSGEKEPKTKWLMTIIGVLALGSAYTIAITVKTPLAALSLFFVAVILVIIGTYALFTAGSIALLKMFRKNKRFFYKTKNFTAVSGMLYRMKQNAAGLANICILSTAVLVMISTTISLYAGLEDSLVKMFPNDIVINATIDTPEQAQALRDILDVKIKENAIQTSNEINYWYCEFGCSRKDNRFSFIGRSQQYTPGYQSIVAFALSDYNRLNGMNETLAQDEVLVYSSSKPYGENSFIIGNKEFKVKKDIDTMYSGLQSATYAVQTYIVVVNDIDVIGAAYLDATGKEPENSKTYTTEFSTNASDEEIIAFTKVMSGASKTFIPDHLVLTESKAWGRSTFLEVYGGLFFLGIFLGTLFLMATVLIIYYKQISEGYDDKERFEIMQKVGMSKSEIKETIRRQILIVFFLPLVFAMIHIAFAFPMIKRLLGLLVLSNTSLFLLSTVATILVFAVIYGIVFSLTARAYYKIVE